MSVIGAAPNVVFHLELDVDVHDRLTIAAGEAGVLHVDEEHLAVGGEGRPAEPSRRP
ncbi:hypothetical protein [Micromonospora sp. NBC_01638]|uniref:hypothetical protein n=1 Tax=Micromonospora sp. NBC_01638 TaxID=2975982 RepID=UPI00386E16A2|nr:hypothetical protein OG811_19615 [Micromonospora sp. NBC_01638]